MYDICSYFYDPYQQTYEWYQLRDKLYGVMFLISILTPLFKTTLLSKSIIVFGAILTTFNIIDKVFLDVFEALDRDWFIILPLASSICYAYYHKRKI